jgi:hypothetical protein
LRARLTPAYAQDFEFEVFKGFGVIVTTSQVTTRAAHGRARRARARRSLTG